MDSADVFRSRRNISLLWSDAAATSKPLERLLAENIDAQMIAAVAAAHAGQGLAFVPLFPFSLVLGFIAQRTGSIVPCILLHALFNAVSVVLLLAQPVVVPAG